MIKSVGDSPPVSVRKRGLPVITSHQYVTTQKFTVRNWKKPNAQSTNTLHVPTFGYLSLACRGKSTIKHDLCKNSKGGNRIWTTACKMPPEPKPRTLLDLHPATIISSRLALAVGELIKMNND